MNNCIKFPEPVPVDPGPTTLYRAYDNGGRLLYIGITNNFNRRLSGHAGKSGWAPLVDRWERQEYLTRSSAMTAEARAICAEDPEFNRHAGHGHLVEECDGPRCSRVRAKSGTPKREPTGSGLRAVRGTIDQLIKSAPPPSPEIIEKLGALLFGKT